MFNHQSHISLYINYHLPQLEENLKELYQVVKSTELPSDFEYSASATVEGEQIIVEWLGYKAVSKKRVVHNDGVMAIEFRFLIKEKIGEDEEIEVFRFYFKDDASCTPSFEDSSILFYFNSNSSTKKIVSKVCQGIADSCLMKPYPTDK
ncbi:MAG: hypothetical protein JXR18_03310 [Neptuniibacter sp.]